MFKTKPFILSCSLIICIVFCSVGQTVGYANTEFTDVLFDYKYSESINSAYEAGIIRGDGTGKFMPDQYLKVNHMYLMFGRAFINKSFINDDECIQECYNNGWINNNFVSMTVGVTKLDFYRTLCMITNIVPFTELKSIYNSAPTNILLMTNMKADTLSDSFKKIGFPVGNTNRFELISRGEAVHAIMLVINKDYKSNGDKILNKYKIHVEDTIDLTDSLWEMSKLPNHILYLFDAKNWKLEINSQKLDIWSTENGKDATGLTMYAKKTIILKDDDSLLHEFGHFIWKYLNKSDRNTFIKLYGKESESLSKLIGKYSLTDYGEYFAESFDYWITNHSYQNRMDEFKILAPKTYDFFKRLESKSWR